MQATAAKAHASVREVAQDLFGLTAYLLQRTSPAMFAALEETGVSMSQFKLLYALHVAEEELSVKALSNHLGCSLPGASRGVEALLQRGLVERREDEEDRRMKRVRISPAGRDVIARTNAIRLDALQQLLSELSDTERSDLATALSPILARDEVAACRPRGNE
jgi:DNA-binding MarR family transcriptional regulator